MGPSYNTKHQLWVVGYTMENEEGEHGIQGKSKELGPSFITIFDAEWRQLQTIQLNNNDLAFRVMTQTEGDDIYIVYDEMDVNGAATVSRARIERYRISVPEPASVLFLLTGLVNLLLWHRRASILVDHLAQKSLTFHQCPDRATAPRNGLARFGRRPPCTSGKTPPEPPCSCLPKHGPFV